MTKSHKRQTLTSSGTADHVGTYVATKYEKILITKVFQSLSYTKCFFSCFSLEMFGEICRVPGKGRPGGQILSFVNSSSKQDKARGEGSSNQLGSNFFRDIPRSQASYTSKYNLFGPPVTISIFILQIDINISLVEVYQAIFTWSFIGFSETS